MCKSSVEKKKAAPKAFLYATYRTENERELRLETDRASMTLIAQNHGAECDGFWFDVGFGAWRPWRKRLDLILKAALRGEFQLLVINRADALASGISESIHIAMYLADCRVEILSADGQKLYAEKAARAPEEVRAIHLKKGRTPYA